MQHITVTQWMHLAFGICIPSPTHTARFEYPSIAGQSDGVVRTSLSHRQLDGR